MPEGDGEDKRGQRPETGGEPAGVGGAGYPLFPKQSWDRVAESLELKVGASSGRE
ncbi:MAG: hypothetical protein GXY83_36360 [Rhodopirellula sp.]|nr:hypothetical protein [Rhodopirellula sp.]